MSVSIQKLIEEHPEELGHLAEPTIDNGTLLLNFGVRDPAFRFHGDGPTLPWTGPMGLIIQFTPNASSNAGQSHGVRWPLIDVGLDWRWTWANKRFEPELQDSLRQIISKEAAPVSSLETRAYRALPTKSPQVIRGHSGLAITIDLVETGPPRIVRVIAANNSDRDLAWREGSCEAILDRIVPEFWYRALASRGTMSDKSPFRTLKPGEQTEIARYALPPTIGPPSSVQLLWSQPFAGYWDVTPTYYDGSPEFRAVPNAWVGTVLSNEIILNPRDN